MNIANEKSEKSINIQDIRTRNSSIVSENFLGKFLSFLIFYHCFAFSDQNCHEQNESISSSIEIIKMPTFNEIKISDFEN